MGLEQEPSAPAYTREASPLSQISPLQSAEFRQGPRIWSADRTLAASLDKVCGIIKGFNLFEDGVRDQVLELLGPRFPRHGDNRFLEHIARSCFGLAEVLVDCEAVNPRAGRELAEAAVLGQSENAAGALRSLLRTYEKNRREPPASLISFWLRSSEKLNDEDIELLFRLALDRKAPSGQPQYFGALYAGPEIDVYKMVAVNSEKSVRGAQECLKDPVVHSEDENGEELPFSRRYSRMAQSGRQPDMDFCRAIENALARLGVKGAYIQIRPEKEGSETSWTIYYRGV
jgi:hypothetical protein